MRNSRIAQIVAWSVVAVLILVVMIGQMVFRVSKSVMETQVEVSEAVSYESSRVELPEPDVHHTEPAHSRPEHPPAPARNDSNLQVYLDQTFDGSGIDSLVLDLGADDVHLYPSQDSSLRVVHRGLNLELDHLVSPRQDGATLTIAQSSSGLVQFFTSLQWESVVEIYLPSKHWDRLDLRLASGSMAFHRELGALTATEFALDIASGEVAADCPISGAVAQVRLASGDIRLQGVHGDRYDIQVSSGTLGLDSLTGSGRVEVTSGDLELLGVEIEESLSLEASSGSVHLQLAGDPGLDFTGEKSSGVIQTYFPVVRHDDQGHRISATVGEAPRKALMVRLASGDMEITNHPG